MSFSSDLKGFSAKLAVNSQALFVNVASHAHQSIVDGSAVTGAPGQPVDTGNLRNSWQLTFETPTAALISTNVEYAPFIEDNVRGVHFKNHGPHSVKMTKAALPRIVDVETAALNGGPSSGRAP